MTDANIEMEMTMTASNTAALADAYALLKAQADEMNERLENMRKEILEAAGADEAMFEGDYYTVKVCNESSSSFDSKMAKTYLNEDQIALCTRKTARRVLRIKEIGRAHV